MLRELEDSKAMRVWMLDLSGRADSTKVEYLRYFKRFLTRWKTTPDELYSMRQKDLESMDPRDHKNIERMVIVLMSEMQEAGLSSSTCRQVAKAVTSFFDAQGMEFRLRARDKPRAIHRGQNLVMVDGIRRMWDCVSEEMRERNRALLAVAKDSGLRVSDICVLDTEDWRSAAVVEHEGEEYRKFEPKMTVKTGDYAHIHLGPEANNAIEKYLETREDSNPALFIDRKDKRLGRIAMIRQFRYLGEKTGVSKISAHSFRKFHRTRLEGAGMPESWIKKLQGKATDPYSHPEQTGELTQRYIQSYQGLRIFGESKQRIDEQAQRIAELERQVEEARLMGRRELEEYKERLRREILEEVRRELQHIEGLS